MFSWNATVYTGYFGHPLGSGESRMAAAFGELRAIQEHLEIELSSMPRRATRSFLGMSIATRTAARPPPALRLPRDWTALRFAAILRIGSRWKHPLRWEAQRVRLARDSDPLGLR